MEWTQVLGETAKQLPVVALLGLISKVLWDKLQTREAEVTKLQERCQALQETRITDLKAMLKQDD